MKRIELNYKNNHHPIIIDNRIIKKIDDYLLTYLLNDKIIFLTQKSIYQCYKENFKVLFSKFDFNIIFLKDDETSKSFSEYKKTINKLVQLKCNRKTTLIAFGGGVVGDLTGFIASTYMRGIDYIQIPTTLLSMIDSSIGGKTGINLSEGKNLIGSFYHPILILIDPTLINTLPKKEVISALGEIIKYGSISNKFFLKYLFNNIDKILMNKDKLLLEKIIIECIKIKVSIVEKDEKEKGTRQILNFGHTLAHALENEIGYGKISHGQAVSYGLVTAAYLSMKLKKLPNTDYQFICSCIRKLSLPLIKKINIQSLIKLMEKDKKNNNNNINFVLLNKIGKPIINNFIKKSMVKEALYNNEYFSN